MKDEIQENSPELKELRFQMEKTTYYPMQWVPYKEQFTVKLQSTGTNIKTSKQKKCHIHRLEIRRALNF